MYLRRPCLADKSAFLEMLAEFEAANSPFVGAISSWTAAKGNFEAWLQLIQEQEQADVLDRGIGRFVHLLSFSDSGDLLGIFSFSKDTTPAIVDMYGHIGYSIRPSQRGKGYGTIQLRLGLLELKQFGLKRLMLVCDADNKPSRQMILANGGVLEDVRESTERYWVEV
ncbi:GNAT family N-acetyltransferase [Streptococcus ovuberis]|uniref:GNAT family N-acetyltransferase n=1 Tax=Streptococcus ovuberis TaxID=1936207 RepID=A0A7X6S0R3_9STRE|nr:GNAT family N-acetyltransferase [Streptococcus ovuberis]NKZ19610.1 GNAT family N-acetyltransferase [Streptococcus ovuberis]